MTARFTGGSILVVGDNRVNSVVTRRLVELAGFTADAADREACSQVGIDTVIEKPIDRARLAELVRRYVLAHGAGAA